MRRREQGALLTLGRGPQRVHRASVSTFVLVSRKSRVDGNELNRLRLDLHYQFCLKLFNVQKRRIGERWGRGAR